MVVHLQFDPQQGKKPEDIIKKVNELTQRSEIPLNIKTAVNGDKVSVCLKQQLPIQKKIEPFKELFEKL